MKYPTLKLLVFGLTAFILAIIFLKSFSGRYDYLTSTLPFALSWTGIVFIIDWADHRWLKKTLGETVLGHTPHRILKIAIVAIPFCLIVESYGVYFTRLWYYPYWNILIYSIAAPFAFILYTYILSALYELVKNLIHQPHRIGRWHNWQERLYPLLMKTELIFGILFFIASTVYVLNSGYYLPVQIFDISKDSGIPVAWWMPFAMSFSVIFIFEFICFYQGKETLTKDVIRGYWSPIFSIIVANIVAVSTIELVNGPFGVWRFANWPFNKIQVVNVPIMALMVWPLHFFGLLAMMRAAFSQKQIKIW